MKRMSLMLLAVLVFSSVYCAAEIPITTAKIPFSFFVEGKTYPAGTYRISANDSESVVTVANEKSGESAGMAMVVTRLAGRTQSGVELVFDVVGKDHYLSEIHVPNRDGYYFRSAPAQHTHEIIKANKS